MTPFPTITAWLHKRERDVFSAHSNIKNRNAVFSYTTPQKVVCHWKCDTIVKTAKPRADENAVTFALLHVVLF